MPIPRLCGALLLALAFASAPAHAQIRIAVAGPMTGALGQLGGEMRTGVEAAVAAINAAGGVLGQQLVVQVGDDAAPGDACSEERGRALANQFAGAGVVFVVGHLCSVPSIAAAEVYAAEGIVQIAPAAPEPRFTEDRAGPGIFRLFGRTDAQAVTAAGFIAARFAGQPVAIVDDSSTYGRSLAGAIREALGGLSIMAAVNESYAPSEADLPTLVRRFATAGVGVVYFAGGPAEAARLRLEMTAQGSTAVLVAGDAAADPDFPATAGAAADGTLFTYPPDPRLDPAAAVAVAAIRAAGTEPDGFTLNAYAAVQIWAAAVAEAGTTDLAPVAREIAAGTFATALGEVTFNADGEADIPGWVMHEWRAGAYAAVPSP